MLFQILPSVCELSAHELLITGFFLLNFLLAIFLSFYFLRVNKRLASDKIDFPDELPIFKTHLSNYSRQQAIQLIHSRIDSAKILLHGLRTNDLTVSRKVLAQKTYSNSLFLNEWDVFINLMDHIYKDLVLTLETLHKLNKNEIVYCCLTLLEISDSEIRQAINLTKNEALQLRQDLARKFRINDSNEISTFLGKLVN